MNADKYASRIADLATPQEVRNFRANAEEKGRYDLVALCDERLTELGQRARLDGRQERGVACAPGSIEDFILRTHERYEAVRATQKGQKFTASRTWQMFDRHGVIGTCERVVGRPKYSNGFAALVEAGEWASAWEVIVLAFPGHFSSKAFKYAHKLLHEHVSDEQIENAIQAMRAEASFSSNPIAAEEPAQPLETELQRFSQVQVRPHQAAFREAVFRKCGGRCVISGCNVPEAVEAAHLTGRNWREGHNSSEDGILLRRDLHALYDAGLLVISDDGLAHFDSKVGSHYRQFEGVLAMTNSTVCHTTLDT
ncbi:HNH endonuclease [Chromobacterium violaceum]|uniref:HNH endonuclease n=1 Tax=Chromobacterium violaceum TaxID=536 RepID=UPI0019514830|nr:HNH endonuclease signature motif containing protein [Chromobacterium violaceum]QRO33316.1 HNH endonuclease [Chromobacterium violaceum]QRQ16880.1 HNH endonuclease [Chromobacterium violaceum]